jgi:hypothetical protein
MEKAKKLLNVLSLREGLGAYKISINTENEVFGDDPGPEIARILRELADTVEGGSLDGTMLRDSNGNTVGSAGFGGKKY